MSFAERGLYHSSERGCCHFDWLYDAGTESPNEGDTNRDRETERQRDRKIERLRDTATVKLRDRATERSRNRKPERQRNRATGQGRGTERWKDSETPHTQKQRDREKY